MLHINNSYSTHTFCPILVNTYYFTTIITTNKKEYPLVNRDTLFYFFLPIYILLFSVFYRWD